MGDWKNVQYKDGKMRTSEGGGGGGSSTFAGLDDVSFNNIQNGQVPKYNSTTQKWVNGADNYPPLIYSDEEREVGVWTDGKPLYQKCIEILSGFANTMTVQYGIDNIDLVTGIGGIGIELSNGNLFTEPINVGPSPGTGYGFSAFDFFSTSCTIACPTAVISRIQKIILIIQYTKTTDTPGSGRWSNAGDQTHHYSTSEQVVGTWIDGKPLYEKTIDFGSISAGGNKTIDISNLSIDTVVYFSGRCTDGNSNQHPISQSHTTNTGNQVFVRYNSTGTLGVYPGSGMALSNTYITIQYTKTTD